MNTWCQKVNIIKERATNINIAKGYFVRVGGKENIGSGAAKAKPHDYFLFLLGASSLFFRSAS